MFRFLSLLGALTVGCSQTPDTLTRASGRGDLKSVRRLLDKGVDVNGKEPAQGARVAFTPLTAAIDADFPDVAALLLERGADPNLVNNSGGAPLTYAVSKRSPERTRCFDLLLARKANPNITNSLRETPLSMAISRGNFDAAKRLLAAGADPNAEAARPPLIQAIGNVPVLQALLAAGANTEIRPWDNPYVAAKDNKHPTALYVAAMSGMTEAAKVLIAAHADVNNPSENYSRGNFDSFTPLFEAAAKGDLAMCRLLIEAGAKVDWTSPKGATVMELAANQETADLLRKAGAKGEPGPAVTGKRPSIELGDVAASFGKVYAEKGREGLKQYAERLFRTLPADIQVQFPGKPPHTYPYICHVEVREGGSINPIGIYSTFGQMTPVADETFPVPGRPDLVLRLMLQTVK